MKALEFPRSLLELSDHTPISVKLSNLRMSHIIKRVPDLDRFNRNWNLLNKNNDLK